MKKLTWALLSLVLLLCTGVAFAEGGPKDGSTTNTLEVPTLDPASGFVRPGTTINGTFTADFVSQFGGTASMYQGGTIFVLYVENDADTKLETTVDILNDYMDQLMERLMGGEDVDEYAADDAEDGEAPSYAYKIASYGMSYDNDMASEASDEEDEETFDPRDYMSWYESIAISDKAAGNVKLRLRVAAVTYKLDNDGQPISGPSGPEMEVVYSNEFTADYSTTLETPTFTPALGEGATSKEVTAGDKITIDYTPKTDAEEAYLLYATNGDESMLDLKSMDDIETAIAYGLVYKYEEPFAIYKGQTIKARAYEFTFSEDYSIYLCRSEVASMTYTIAGGDKENPTIPTLTLSDKVLPVTPGGTAEFSVTLDMKEYAEEKIVFAISCGAGMSGYNTEKGDMAKLEYKVGDNGTWTEWPADQWENFGKEALSASEMGLPADPSNTENDNACVFNVAKDKTVKINYRVTFAAEVETAPRIMFVLADPVGGKYSYLSEDFATKTVSFMNGYTGPTLTLAPMKGDTVGYNEQVKLTIADAADPFSENWMNIYKATVYYTTDGTTEPTKAAYEAQADKDNGAIKMMASEMNGPFPVANGNTGAVLFFTFNEDSHLKARGYMTVGDEEVVTGLFDKEIKVKSYVKPEITPIYTDLFVGEKITIYNPDPAPGEDDPGYETYNPLYPTSLYYSFSGMAPLPAAYEDLEWDDASILKKEGENVEITIRKDEKGFYAFVFEAAGNYNSPADTVRIEGNKLSFQVLCQSYMATGKKVQSRGSMVDEMMPYASDIVSVEYTIYDRTLPATVTKPTFVPAPTAGALAKGDVIKWTMDAAYDKYNHDGVSAVAYVINGKDEDLTAIDETELGKLMEEKMDSYITGYRQEGKVYLYEGEADAFPIEKTGVVKACQVVAISGESETDAIQIALSEIVTANYTVDASKLAKPTFKTPIAGSTVEPKSPITFEMPFEYDWSAYTNAAYILYVENNDEVKLEGSAEDIMNANPQTPATGAKAGLAYKVVNCHKDGDDLNWTEALIATQEGALKIRARLAGVTKDDEVFYSDEITVNCTVKKGEDVDPGTGDPQLPETVKTPTFVPAAGKVNMGQPITWTWDEEAYNENKYPMIAVAYVVNGEDANLDITVENFGELWEASQDEDENTVREEGETYLYRTDVDDAYPYLVVKACTVKARMLIGVANIETGEISIALSPIVEAAYTIEGEPVETVAKPTFDPVAGAVKRGTKVTVSCETEGAVIYYTVDGTEPTDKSTKYEAAIEINEAMTVKAIAIKGEAKSEVAEAAYTIDLTANEDLELAGVSVYPNPSNGLFNLELPVAATVEVFASNGVLVQRMKLGEGNATLNIERSGIYFLRITGEGRTAIKRVIVR